MISSLRSVSCAQDGVDPVADASRLIKLSVLVAASFMLLPLPIMEYVGEEGLYAVKAWEMHVRQDWWHPSILGSVWPHPPLFHWPVILLASLIGWEHVDLAQRLVSVAASWGSAAVAAQMARRLFPRRRYAAWLAALIYLTMGEVCFWYGWLGYADATFGFLIFAAVACLWLALAHEHAGWLVLSLCLITLAYLTKNFTAYVLYGMAGLILLLWLRKGRLLGRPRFLLPVLMALIPPLGFQAAIIHSDANTLVTWHDILRNFHGYSLSHYLRHWLTFPFVFLFRALPISLLLLWLLMRGRWRPTFKGPLVPLAMIILAWFAPFWLAAGGSPRYLVPLYGPASLLLTGWLLELPAQRMRTALRLCILVLVLKIPYSFAVLPWLKDWRPNHSLKAVAADILQRTKGKPVRTENDIASGIGVAAYMNVQLPPQHYIRWYRGKEHGVFIMTEVTQPELGRLVRDYPIRGRHLYLYWHG